MVCDGYLLKEDLKVREMLIKDFPKTYYKKNDLFEILGISIEQDFDKTLLVIHSEKIIPTKYESRISLPADLLKNEKELMDFIKEKAEEILKHISSL